MLGRGRPEPGGRRTGSEVERGQSPPCSLLYLGVSPGFLPWVLTSLWLLTDTPSWVKSTLQERLLVCKAGSFSFPGFGGILRLPGGGVCNWDRDNQRPRPHRAELWGGRKGAGNRWVGSSARKGIE